MVSAIITSCPNIYPCCGLSHVGSLGLPRVVQLWRLRPVHCLSFRVGHDAEEVNALYDLLTSEDGQAPKFRQRGKDVWLYYAIDGRWHFGGGSAAAQNLPGHRFRSGECKVGTLPVDISSWEVRDMRDLRSGSKRPSFTASSARQPGSAQGLDGVQS